MNEATEHARMQRPAAFNNRDLFVTVLKSGKYKTEVPKVSPLSENPFPGLFSVCAYRERKNFCIPFFL